jgi:RimJ/RimL family protein N-acetyltransferase
VLTDYYAAYGLRLRTPRLELRLPHVDDLAALADIARDGVHDPADQPFSVPWTDWAPPVRGRAVITYHLALIASSTPASWELPFAVFFEDRPIGIQGLRAERFAVLREVDTGSWIGRRFHGQGLGTEMRAAVLELAFEGLDAQFATSAAREDNAGSHAVSRKLGYVHDGIKREQIRDQVATMNRLRLSREAWQRHRSVPVTIDGLDGCAADLGIA